jgi:hypothetical protein
MILVDRFSIQDRLDGFPVVVRSRGIIAACELGNVPVLAHVEVQPVRVMEVLCRTMAGGMKGPQLSPAVALADPGKADSVIVPGSSLKHMVDGALAAA